MRPDELMAAAILAELLDARAEANDVRGQGSGRFDWRLAARDRTYAVEVTSHSDEARREFDVVSEKHGGIYREIPDLAGFYSVRVETTANLAKLWDTIPALVRDHFPDGIGHHDLARMRWDPDDPLRVYAELMTDVGVLWITGQRIAGHSGMQIAPEAGWWQHGTVAAQAAIGELESNRAKLAAAVDVDERHLFVWIHPSALAAHFSLRDEELPAETADLGEGIDVLWVAGADTSRRPAAVWRLWRVKSGQPWEDWTAQVRA